MSPVLLALLFVFVLPFLTVSRRVMLFGLFAQGALITWHYFARHVHHDPVESCLEVIDLVLVRGILAPWLLHRAFVSRKQRLGPGAQPKNVLSWGVLIALGLMVFQAAGVLEPTNSNTRLLVGIAGFGVVAGLVGLTTRTDAFGRVAAVIGIENAIALMELRSDLHHDLPVLQVGLIALILIAVLYYRWFLLSHRGSDGAVPASLQGIGGELAHEEVPTP